MSASLPGAPNGVVGVIGARELLAASVRLPPAAHGSLRDALPEALPDLLPDPLPDPLHAAMSRAPVSVQADGQAGVMPLLRIRTMRRALAEFTVEGIKTTIPLLKEIFENADFAAGHVDTTYIERTWSFTSGHK